MHGTRKNTSPTRELAAISKNPPSSFMMAASELLRTNRNATRLVLRYSERCRHSVERRLRVGEGLHVRVLGVRCLELVDVAVDEGGRLVEVAADADQVHERVRVVLALADGLLFPRRTQRVESGREAVVTAAAAAAKAADLFTIKVFRSHFPTALTYGAGASLGNYSEGTHGKERGCWRWVLQQCSALVPAVAG